MREEILGIKTMGEKINNLFKAAYKRNFCEQEIPEKTSLDIAGETGIH